jgi:hypothetical protein
MLAVAYCIYSDPEIMVCDLRKCRVLRFCVNGDNCINVYEVLIKQNSQGKGNVWTNPKVSPP